MFSGVSYMSTYSSNTEIRIIPHIHNPTMRTTPHNEKRIMLHIHNTAKLLIPHTRKRIMPYSSWVKFRMITYGQRLIPHSYV